MSHIRSGRGANDIREAVQYLKKERGLRSILRIYGCNQRRCQRLFSYFGGIFPHVSADSPLPCIPHFPWWNSSDGQSAAQCNTESAFPKKKRYGFAFFVYQIYEAMDMCLLWLPYPLMLVNRGICGFLGSNSAIMRNAAVQRYIPERTALTHQCIQRSDVNRRRKRFLFADGYFSEKLPTIA